MCSFRALAPVREPGTFASVAELQNVPNITPVCAANILRQKNGGLELNELEPDGDSYRLTATLQVY